MSRSILLPLVSVAVLAVGCISVKTPDVSVDVMYPYNAYKRSESSREPEPAPSERLRYTPYAKTLERVNRQQIRVTEQSNKRDWEDTEEEADTMIGQRPCRGILHRLQKLDRLAMHSRRFVEPFRSGQRHRQQAKDSGHLWSRDRLLAAERGQ